MFAIIDYGMGNLHSVSKALERLGHEYRISDQAETILAAEGVILPGVGAFADAMKQLQKTGLDQVINQVAAQGTPLLGICLGMQLLFTSSDEGGNHRGLNLLEGQVKRLSGVNVAGESYKVPHMGWNQLHYQQPEHPLLVQVEPGYTYFVHSFYVERMKDEDLIAYADYHVRVPGIVGQGQILGMQFHPEKSGKTGMSLLSNFCQISKKAKSMNKTS